MAFTEGNGGGGLSAADVAAVMNGNGNNGWGFGNDGGAWWILILFLFAFSGGGWGGFGGGANGALPYAMTATTQADIQRGFDNQAVQAGIAGINTTLANGFADAAVARCNAQTTTLQALSNNQMGLYQTLNANQNANTQAMNSLAMSLQNCCCENRAGLADLKYTIATENCADRQAISDGIRDLMAQNTANTNAIVQSQNAGFQGIQDKLCQLEIDGLKQANEQLRTQLNMANLAASQNAQTAQLIQDNNAQTAALIQRIAPAPVPAYPVQNPNCCAPVSFGCGCGSVAV